MSKPYIDLGSWKPGQLTTGTGMSEEMWKATGNLMMIRADQYFADQRQLNDLKAENARLTAQVAAGRQMRGAAIAVTATWDTIHATETHKSYLKELYKAIGEWDAATAPADAKYDEDDEDDALTAYAEDMGAPADADPMNAMNAHSERIEQPVPLDPFRREWIRETEGILAKHEQRIDELAARVEAHFLSINGLHNRTTKLEADARQPPPPPSAPVTESLVRVAQDAFYEASIHHREATAIREALEAAFAARDREDQS